MNRVIEEWFAQNEEAAWEVAREIWENPEVAYEEKNSCQILARYMEQNGFDVQTLCVRSADGSPNGLKAVYGKGKPVIGILGELDALPGLAQEAVPYESRKTGPGHGCGHNLLAAGCAAGAIGAKAVLEKEGLSGTIVFFGCPAEETISGKVIMASMGCFDDMDICLTWHPGGGPGFLIEFAGTALTNIVYEFHGKSAHAADNAYMGRSALDAAELMNVGSNYLREHVTKNVSFHYSYLSAGTVPNIVPDYAAVNYSVRAGDRKTCDEVVERVTKIAQGAALMTETSVNIRSQIGCYEYLVNHRLNRAAYEAWKKIPPISYSEEDRKFAAEIYKNIQGKEIENVDEILQTDIVAPKGITDTTDTGSTDVADVTQICPTINLYGFGIAGRIPGHHWGVTACAGSEIGKKGMIFAAKGLAQLCYDAVTDSSIVGESKEEFRKSKENKEPYRSRV